MKEATKWQSGDGQWVVQEAGADDCERIGELALQLIRLEYSLNAGTGEPTPWAGSTAEIRKQMAQPTTKFLIAERNGEMAGYARIDLHGVDRDEGGLRRMARRLFERLSRRPRANHYSSGGVISGILVTPPERRTGAGQLLVEAAEEWLRHRGVTRVYVHVLRNNLPALRFWERTGYEPATIVLSKEIARVE